MSIVRIANPDQIRPLHVVLICLVLAVLIGVGLLTCGQAGSMLPDGAVAWQADSLFPALVQLLNLRDTQPTPLGVEIKSLVFGIGSALAVIVVAVAAFAGARRGEQVTESDTVVEVLPDRGGTLAVKPLARRQISPLAAGQVFAVFYLGWSFLSALWAGPAPEIALTGSVVLAVSILWALALGWGLSREAGRSAAYAVVVAGVAVAVMACWYRMVRNPTLRASYPIGNPITLAAWLLPGLVIGLAVWTGGLTEVVRRRRYRWIWVVAVLPVAMALMVRAFVEADSRGPMVGLAASVAALVFLLIRGRVLRWVLVGLGVVSVAGGLIWLVQARDSFSPTGRSASMRVRFYGNEYALDLAAESIVIGHGQGGYVRRADALAVNDVMNDPLALSARLGHAHNEYAEILVDLGVVGLVLFAGALVLTGLAAVRAVPSLPQRSQRWVLIGLTAALFGLAVQEAVGVGLRLPGLPTMFYTVLGLTWAMCHRGSTPRLSLIQRSPWRRWLSLKLGLAVGFTLALLSTLDFTAARAQYEMGRSQEAGDWDAVLDQADYAARWRLPPLRHLAAMERQAAARVVVAEHYQNQAFRRLRKAVESTPPDRRLLSLAEEDVAIVETQIRNGLALVTDLLEKAPRYWNANWLQAQLRMLRFQFAVNTGDRRGATQYAEAAAEALQRELQRRPYDALLAVNLARLSVEKPFDGQTLDAIFDSLARPIRYGRLIPAYRDWMLMVSDAPTFPDAFPPVLQRTLQATAAASPADWACAFAPERLRLCAIQFAVREDYARACELAEQAAALYPQLTESDQAGLDAPYVGLASAEMELAEYRFLADPDNPQSAIEATELALRDCPNSYTGRQIVQAIRRRLVTYHLAAGHEDFVRTNLLPDLTGRERPAGMDVEVAARYTGMCGALLHREADALPARLRAWIGRALELNPADPNAWLIEAELAYRDDDDARCVESLENALTRGADPRIVIDFVVEALGRTPHRGVLRAFFDRLKAEFDLPELIQSPGPVEGPSTQPAPPAAPQPFR